MLTELIEWCDAKIEVPPDADIMVLIVDEDGEPGTAVYDDEYGRWVGPGGYIYQVRYWAHLPGGPADTEVLAIGGKA